MNTAAQLDFFQAPPAPAPVALLGLADDDADGLRYYQREAYDAVVNAFAKGRDRIMVVMATGLGKTQLFAAVAKHWPGRVLVLAHRKELVDQARARIEQMTGEEVGVEMADQRAWRNRIIVGSVQTLCKPKRRQRVLAGGAFTLVIVDELHHYCSKTYKDTLLAFGCKVLGVTATPERGDKKALGQVVEECVYEKQIWSGIEEGWLVPLVGEAVHLQSIDLSNVKTTAGDLNLGQLDEEMLKAVEGVVKETLRLYPDRCGPMFFPGKASARMAAERFNALSPGSARCLTDDTPPMERAQLIRDVRAGRVQWLCNVLVATEGFDWPGASLVGLARPTKSRVIHCQMVGRGTRTLPGTIDAYQDKHLAPLRVKAIAASAKPDCIILDFVGNSGKHELVSLVDLMAGSFSEAEIKLAKKLEKEEKGDSRALLNKARAELKRIAAAAQSRVTASVERFDVFRSLGLSREKSTEHELRNGYEPATPAQLTTLRDAGVDISEGLSKHDASKAIVALHFRRKHQLATVKQLKALAKFGWEDRQVKFSRARAMLDYAASKNWRNVDLETLTKIAQRKES